MVVNVLLEDSLLIHDGVTLTLKVIATGKPAVQGCYLVSCD